MVNVVVGATAAGDIPTNALSTAPILPETATVHPLVLLSAVDHYNRVAKNTKKRVVGVLLGQRNGTTVNVANSFAGRNEWLYSRHARSCPRY